MDLMEKITNCTQLKAVVDPDMPPGKSNANDESDFDMPEIDYEFSDRYAGAESDELDDFSRLDICGKLKNMCEKETEEKKQNMFLKRF